jgi:hypothetical protein
VLSIKGTDGKRYYAWRGRVQPHQQRVIEEQKELTEKLVKLSAFLGTAVFSKLPEAEKLRMRRQFMIMQLYEQVLQERLEAFQKAGKNVGQAGTQGSESEAGGEGNEEASG